MTNNMQNSCYNAKSEHFILVPNTNLKHAYLQIENAFLCAEIDDAAFDAHTLLFHVTGKDRRVFPQDFLTNKQAEDLTHFVIKRLKRVPLQYIIGEWDFMDFTLKVGPGVLIPRSDTEVVCITAIETARKMQQQKNSGRECLEQGELPSSEQFTANVNVDEEVLNIADLCAGSGAIAIGVKRNMPQAKVMAVELYDKAIYYLALNVEKLASDIKIFERDVIGFEKDVLDLSLDIIVCNPPYVSEREMKTLKPELFHEPETALVAQDNGLYFYKYIANEYKSKLKSGGAIVFEIGSAQGEEVSAILAQNGYNSIEIIKDASENDRCIRAFK